jgi:hypothetical protein
VGVTTPSAAHAARKSSDREAGAETAVALNGGVWIVTKEPLPLILSSALTALLICLVAAALNRAH